jgi:hypothetical protein
MLVTEKMDIIITERGGKSIDCNDVDCYECPIGKFAIKVNRGFVNTQISLIRLKVKYNTEKEHPCYALYQYMKKRDILEIWKKRNV